MPRRAGQWGKRDGSAESSVKEWEMRKQTDQKNSDTNLIPAEKLTTGKKRPSMLKFSNMP